MSGTHGVARVMRWTAGGLGLIAVGYARVSSASPDERDPVGNSESMFRTETRVTTTDQMARTKFRW